jgi:hypothetical protein
MYWLTGKIPCVLKLGGSNYLKNIATYFLSSLVTVCFIR